MSDIKRVGQRLKKHLTQTIDGIPGELGKLENSGSYTVPTGEVNRVHVRLNGDPNNTVTAVNLVTQWKARLPVLVRLTPSGFYKVIGTDPLKIEQFMGADSPSASMPPVRGAATDAIWESYQFNPGRVHALNGSDLQVRMEPLSYFGKDLTATGNMATAVGTITTGKKAWVGVAIDPDTEVLSFTKGTEYSLPIPLTRAQALEVTTPTGEIPLWAYATQAGDTYVPVQKRGTDTEYFVDRRPWLQPQPTTPDTTTATVGTSDATATTLASIAVAEASLLTITGTFSGVKDDYSAAISGTFVAGVRRATAGDATLVGVTVTSNEDSSGTPSFTVDADIGTESARLKVTGIAAETWNWSVRYSTLVT